MTRYEPDIVARDARIVSAYRDGMSLRAIAAIEDVSHQTCSNVLDRSGVERRSTSLSPALVKTRSELRVPKLPDDRWRSITDYDLDWIISRRIQGASLSEIGREIGYTSSDIRTALRNAPADRLAVVP